MVFSEGLAAVEKDGRYGYIDTSGKTAIPFKYDFAIEFENGYASVSLDGEDQVIDKTGKNVYINRDNYDGVSTIGTNGKTTGAMMLQNMMIMQHIKKLFILELIY